MGTPDRRIAQARKSVDLQDPLQSTAQQIDRHEADRLRLSAVGRLAAHTARTLTEVLDTIHDSAKSLMELDCPLESRAQIGRILAACDQGRSFNTLLGAMELQSRRPPVILDLRDFLRNLDLGGLLSGNVLFCEDLPTTPCRVLADPEDLAAAMVQLVRNARDAVGGHGFVRIAAETLPGRTIDGRRSGGWVRLQVSDDGCGMDGITSSRACEPFFTTKIDPPGMGLGLNIAMAAFQRARGILTLSTAPSQGTRVSAWLPAAPEVRAWT